MTPLEAIYIARTEGYNPGLQQIIVSSGDPEFAYRFAQDVAEADLDTLRPIVLKSDDLRTVYDFAVLKSERGGDIALLQERMLACRDGGLLILFAMDVAGADVERFEAALRLLPDAKYLLLLDAEKRQRGME